MNKIPKETICGHQPYYAKGLCRKCYQREAYVHKRQNPEYVERKRIQTQKYDSKRIRPPNHNDKRKLKAFGLTIDDYQEIFEAQDGVCAICGREPGKKKLAIDHDHKTGVIRGLLCFRCNFGLGWFQDDLEQLHKAIAHLEGANITCTKIASVKKQYKGTSKHIHVGFKNGTTE